MTDEKVLRHSSWVRLIHWLVALSGFVLVFTSVGELPMYKRYNLVKVPGFHWAGDFELNLVIHYLAAFVFTAAILFHLVYHLRRREFSALPKRGDARESIRILKAMLTGKEEPPHGKFLAEQRLAYVAMGLICLVLVVTGLIKTYKNLGAIVLPPEGPSRTPPGSLPCTATPGPRPLRCRVRSSTTGAAPGAAPTAPAPGSDADSGTTPSRSHPPPPRSPGSDLAADARCVCASCV
jgi:hypothetical protein